MRATIFMFLAFTASTLIGSEPLQAKDPKAFSQYFSICSSVPRVNCVVDGDTFWMGGQKIRLAGIDAPETHYAHCEEERLLGLEARQRLLNWVNAGSFELLKGKKDRDRYGRLLRSVSRDGMTAGKLLIEAGMARSWQGKRQSWCPKMK